jgi:hypothetical protein
MKLSNPVVLGSLFFVTLLIATPSNAFPKKADVETTERKVTQLVTEFVGNLKPNRVQALFRVIETPWHSGEFVIEKKDILELSLKRWAEWFDEDGDDFKIMVADRYKNIKAGKTSDLSKMEAMQIDTFLGEDDWVVILGRDNKPKFYVFVKEKKGKLQVIGVHK